MPTNAKYPTPQDFITAIRPAALAIEGKFGIPWMFAATQAAHESRYGNSKLTVDANNLFGMTADNDGSWAKAGKPIYEIKTLEYGQTGNPYTEVRAFRKYADWEESLSDWAGLVIRRYPQAFHAATLGDFEKFAQGLQSGGYATDPQYATQLVRMHSELEALA